MRRLKNKIIHKGQDSPKYEAQIKKRDPLKSMDEYKFGIDPKLTNDHVGVEP